MPDNFATEDTIRALDIVASWVLDHEGKEWAQWWVTLQEIREAMEAS